MNKLLKNGVNAMSKQNTKMIVNIENLTIEKYEKE